MSKRKKKNIFKATCFIAVFLVMFELISFGLKVSDRVTMINIKGLEQEEENSIDVALLGASEVYAGFSPTEAWKKYGFTSYSYGMSGAPGTVYKSMLQTFRKKQNPSVIIVEINGFMHGDEYLRRAGKLHSWLDNIEWDDSRSNAIEEVIPEAERSDYSNMFSTYHSNWKNPMECIKCMFVRAELLTRKEFDLKGYATISGEASNKKLPMDDKYILSEKSKECFQGFINYCKSEKLENVLFVRFPHSKEVENKDSVEEIKNIVSDNGYNFLDLDELKDDIGIQLVKDYYNSDHLNVNGMEKLTDYLSEYILSNYNVPTREDKSKEICDKWDKSAKKADEVIGAARAATKVNIHKRYYELTHSLNY